MADVAFPVTRLRMAEDLPGCTKLTLFPCPTEKPFQLTIAFSEPCVTVIVEPDVPITTDPETV